MYTDEDVPVYSTRTLYCKCGSPARVWGNYNGLFICCDSPSCWRRTEGYFIEIEELIKDWLSKGGGEK